MWWPIQIIPVLLATTALGQQSNGLDSQDNALEGVGKSKGVQNIANVGRNVCPKKQPTEHSACDTLPQVNALERLSSTFVNVSSGIRCVYGSACCCGSCDDSIVFTCSRGSWSAYHTLQHEICKSGDCGKGPVDGGWSEWHTDLECNYGQLTYYRDCNNPAPANGGRECSGRETKKESCAVESWCECTSLTVWDGRTSQHIGNCLTSTRGRGYWCYVSSNTECPDRRPSSRSPGLYYSHRACDTQEPAPFMAETNVKKTSKKQ